MSEANGKALQFWVVTDDVNGKTFSAPSVNGAITARASGTRIVGRLDAINADERDELAEVMRQAVAEHERLARAREEKRAEQEAQAVVAPETSLTGEASVDETDDRKKPTPLHKQNASNPSDVAAARGKDAKA